MPDTGDLRVRTCARIETVGQRKYGYGMWLHVHAYARIETSSVILAFLLRDLRVHAY